MSTLELVVLVLVGIAAAIYILRALR